MRSFLVLLFVVLNVSVSSQTPATGSGNPVSGSGKVYALVIGISKYLQKDIPELQYADRDARVFSDYLRSKAGGSVPAENIQLLVNEQATSSAIYDAIYWIRNTCKKDDLVFFYFSGHGDVENLTMYKNGFLICYDSPPNNYVNLSLSVEYLNNIANTLSAETKANVVLITDACHSGKLAGSNLKGNSLVGEQLRAVKDAVKKKEVRLTACAADQLSNEMEDWGGGRGVFSYYLINGLKGLADKEKDGIITVEEIRKYFDTSFANDLVLKRENIKQTPVLNGREDFVLAKVDETEMKSAAQEMAAGFAVQMNRSSDVTTPAENIPANPREYVIYLLKNQNLEALTDSLKLHEMPAEQIPFAIINAVKEYAQTDAGRNTITEFEKTLRENTEGLKRFKGRLAVAFDETGQQVIDQYLAGDAAELERRRYYNIASNGYDVYPKMFAVALKLTQPDNYLYNILKVKLHYFTGVAARLKIPTVEDPRPLIEKAFAEQKKALALEEHAAYIFQELGILYVYKKDYAAAEKHFLKASEIAPAWAIPWSNLVSIYVGDKRFDLATAAVEKAKELQPALQNIPIDEGMLFERKNNLLLAEELYRKSIRINSRHYFPFERIGYLKMITTDYAESDSFFNEGEVRKQNYHFEPPSELNNPRQMKLPKLIADHLCAFDQSEIERNDVMGNFALAMYDTRNGPDSLAEEKWRRLINLDKRNPLAYHYFGKLLFDQKRWKEADIVFNLAIKYYLDSAAFKHYFDSLEKRMPPYLSKVCIAEIFRKSYYHKTEDHQLAGSVYEAWHHYSEAEEQFRKIINIDPAYFGGYYLLWRLYEKTGRYKNAEDMIRSYAVRDSGDGNNELYSFYKRMCERFPESADWHYKTGLFLYNVAAEDKDNYSWDVKFIEPDTNEEVYQSDILNGPHRFPKIKRLRGSMNIILSSRSINMPRTEGIEYLLKADSLIQDDDDASADINQKIGDLYVWQGLPGNATAYYKKASELKPGDAAVRLKLIDTYSASYLYQDALVQLDSLNRRGEINLAKQLLLAKYYILAARFGAADTLLKDAQKINPDMMPAIVELNGRLQLLSQHPNEALGFYSQLLKLNDKDPCTLYTIARLYAKLGNMPEAWKWLEASLKKGFNYSYVLKFDPYMKPLRSSARWNVLLKNFTMKTYPSPETASGN